MALTATLFIVDDLDYIRSTEAFFFRPLAGKNQRTADNKYKTMSLIQERYVLCVVCNFSQTHFAALREEAFLNQINKVELKAEHKVKPVERMTNFLNE